MEKRNDLSKRTPSAVGIRLVAISATILASTGCAPKFRAVKSPSPMIAAPMDSSNYIYRTVGACDDGTLLFKYLSGSGIMVSTDPSQPIVVGQISVFMMEDKTYTAQYFEYSDDTRSQTEQLQGTYSIQDGTIDFDGLGTAEYFELGNKWGIELTLGRDIITTGASGHKVILRSILSTDGLNDTSAAHCSW